MLKDEPHLEGGAHRGERDGLHLRGGVHLGRNLARLLVQKLKLLGSKNMQFFENTYYHFYNRTNNEEALFRSDENYLYFLKKYRYYLDNFFDTIAYCLMPTHFHFLVKVKAIEAHNSGKDGPHHEGGAHRSCGLDGLHLGGGVHLGTYLGGCKNELHTC